ncbi:hypothetical protein NL676_029185 [Syzygium grande]|nr:hypothetical protein NL676_029185 [Syzygium grande]
MDSRVGSHSYPFTESEAVRGKSIFQARVTENFGNQYTIETVTDGKPLGGILFFNEPSTLPIPFSSSSRKRTYGDSSTGIGNGDYDSESKASRSIQPESVDDRQADDVHGKEATSQEPLAEPAGPVAVSNVTQRFLRTDLDKQLLSFDMYDPSYAHKSNKFFPWSTDTVVIFRGTDTVVIFSHAVLEETKQVAENKPIAVKIGARGGPDSTPEHPPPTAKSDCQNWLVCQLLWYVRAVITGVHCSRKANSVADSSTKAQRKRSLPRQRL